MGVEFKKLSEEETAKLRKSLRDNAETGRPLHMDPLTTGWVSDEGLTEEQALVNAIASVPCHY